MEIGKNMDIKKIKNIISRHDCIKPIFWTIILILSLLALVPFFSWLVKEDCTEIFSDLAIPILTLLIAYIAWIQLKGIYNNSKTDMLIRINQLLRDDNISKAMKILREIRFGIENEFIQNDPNKITLSEIRKKCRQGIIEKIGLEIKNRSDNTEKEIQLENVDLVNFLNTIEVVCYLCQKNYISSEDIEELFNHELSYYFEIFKPYIDRLRGERPSGETIYCEVEKLYEKIQCKKFCS
jgi:hypothetical protein